MILLKKVLFLKIVLDILLDVDCKTVGFFSKSVEKSVKRGLRVLLVRSA